MLKRIMSMLIGITVLLAMNTCVFASSEDNAKYGHMLYNEETKITQSVAENDYTRYQEIPLLDAEAETIYQDPNIPMPRVLYPVLTSYTQSKKTIDNEAFYSGTCSGDNRQSSVPLNLTYESNTTGTARVSATVTATASTDFNLIVSKVNATVSIGGTMERSWTKGKRYGAAVSIPARKQGQLTAYIPGTFSSGTGHYKVYNSSDSSYFTDTKGIGAKVPSKNSWHIKSKVW